MNASQVGLSWPAGTSVCAHCGMPRLVGTHADAPGICAFESGELALWALTRVTGGPAGHEFWREMAQAERDAWNACANAVIKVFAGVRG